MTTHWNWQQREDVQVFARVCVCVLVEIAYNAQRACELYVILWVSRPSVCRTTVAAIRRPDRRQSRRHGQAAE